MCSTIPGKYLERIVEFFPDLQLRSCKLNTDGFVNDVVIVNDNRIFRFPRNDTWAKECLNHEVRVLRVLSSHLYMQVPQFDVVEEDFEESPELANSDPVWTVQASGDFDGDGFFDLFWQNHETRETKVWFMNGATAQVMAFPRVGSASWLVEASADLDGSGTYDLFWRSLNGGKTAVWLMEGDGVRFAASEVADLELQVANVVDENEDGSMDLVWQDTAGDCEVWLMSGAKRLLDPTPIGAPACPILE